MSFALRHAWASLRGGGQRTFLAAACIAFGVLSLVALQRIAGTFSEAVLVDPRASLGGDLVAHRGGAALTPGDLALLASMTRAGAFPASPSPWP